MINSPDLECDEDPAVCDCAYHDNARRAAATHSQWDDPDAPLRGGWAPGTNHRIGDFGEFIGPPDARQVAAVRATRPLDNDPPRCNQCGREPPTHARHCPKVSPFGPTADELAAQLRQQTHDAQGNVRDCEHCGNLLPLHQPGCKLAPGRAPAFKLEMHGAEGDAMCCVFNVIRAGGTLVLTGPNSVISPNDRQFGATLEDARGELSANAIGNELGDCLVGLVREWRRLEQLDEHQAEHDRALS